ncbi:MAG: peptidoglycan bridge formation glycyltransferase FemA/FemB family protein [Anaerolineae bacterium]|nr:peptidoglycan bridge formation glycyltransferase FemA/FemB family protein [Anaerolineae bacterium]
MMPQRLTGVDTQQWDTFVTAHPDAHVLQTSDWGRLKSAFGWSSQIVGVGDDSGRLVAGAQILYRPLPFRLGTMAYIPAGPLFCGDNPINPANVQLWTAVDQAAKSRRAVFLKVEPCNWYHPRPDLPAQFQQAGLRPSPQTIQPPRTIVIDLTGGEDAVLARMNQSTRYKSKLGPKKEVVVREGTRADVAHFNALMAVTGERDKFGVHAPAYYQQAFDLFSPGERCALLIASYNGRDLAGVMAFRCGENSYYFYGASSNEERNRMPTYIVQWAAIQWAMRHGAIRYDLWGIPDAEPDVLEAAFENRRDGLWGVYGFKRGYGGQIVRSVGAWDKVYNPLLYAAYVWYVGRRQAL